MARRVGHAGTIATVTLNPSLDEWIELRALRVGVLNRARNFIRYPGGKGINVSRVIHELGGLTVAYAPTGGDDGAILRRLMGALAVPYEFVEVPGLTRNNYKIITERPRAVTEVNTSGPRMPLRALQRLTGTIFAPSRRPRCLVLSGSLPPGVPQTFYQRMIARARRAGIPCVLDASGAALRLGLRAGPWMCKPNRHEAEELLSRRIRGMKDAARAAAALLSHGASMVVLSMGGQGAVLASRQPSAIWYAAAPRVRICSAVGSGDSLIAGYVTGWARGWTVPEALRLGVASGSACAMTPGTELCRRQDVERLLPRVRLRRLS